jgi:hypothetical protein
MRLCVKQTGYLVAALIVGLVPVGCTQSSGKVTGTVLRDKKPIPVSATGVVQVTLVPDVGAGTEYTTYIGRCDENGKFEILNVKPGKYKVVVEHLDPDPQTDKLNGEFSLTNTKIVRQIDGKSPVEIDLANP